MDTAGSGLCRLTDDQTEDNYPRWSPDGTQIAYIAGIDPSNPQNGVWVSDVNGNNRRKLTDKPIGVTSVGWWVNGQEIIYTSAGQLLAIHLLDQTTRALASDRVFSSAVQSPDGTQVAYVSVDKYLYLMNSDGSNPRRLTTGDYLVKGLPAWSPDGSQIAFVAGTRNGDQLYTVTRDGQNYQSLMQVTLGFDDLHWLKDGRLAFTAFTLSNGDIGDRLYFINADGSALTKGFRGLWIFTFDWWQ